MMHNSQKRPTRALQPPLRTIQASDNEIIVPQAALLHYQRFIAADQQLVQATPLIQRFIARLHEQLFPHHERIEGV